MKNVLKTKVNIAKVLGGIAFAKDIQCVPMMDKEVIALTEGMKVGEGADKIFKAWLNGWHTASLSS